jgi:hypothetical protein
MCLIINQNGTLFFTITSSQKDPDPDPKFLIFELRIRITAKKKLIKKITGKNTRVNGKIDDQKTRKTRQKSLIKHKEDHKSSR